MIHQLVFDTTNPDADSHNVGAYVRSSDGTLIDSVTIATVDRLAVDATMKDGAGNALTSTGGALDINVASGNLSVDLSHTGDSVALGDGTNLLTSTTVSSDIGLDVYIIGSSALTVNDAALANTDLANGATSVDNTAGGTTLVSSALSDRKYLFIANEGNKKAFIGKLSTVTAANGFPLAPGAMLELRAGAAVSPAAITSSGTADTRYLELS